MAKRKTREQKGTFSPLKLPVADRYVRPARRRRIFLWSGLGMAAVLAIWAADLVASRGLLFSQGPLSSNHASFERDCSACHGDSGGLPPERCSVCHEKFGDRLGVYTFAAHVVYRSRDPSRLEDPERKAEVRCAACHTEHRGREADITRVPDLRCQACHPFSFGRGHPQFEFARESRPDAATLEFTHVRHTAKVMKDRGLADHEQACLYCHNARADGRSFEEIDYDRHCDACHLPASVGTPRLPERPPAEVGVLSVESIRARGGLGTLWTDYASPAEFQRLGGRIRKLPVYHEDPWVLDNLRTLRRAVHPDADLADLLTASSDVPPSGVRTLYEEALDTLAEYAAELRSRPEEEVQEDLRRIGRWVTKLRRDLDDVLAPLDLEQFRLAARSAAPPERRAEIEELAADLTEPCRQCHRVADQTIARVQKDQRVLRRAEFDHRAHILVTRCLDCHVEIPILENLAAYRDRTEPADPAFDGAALQNVPGVETCRRCHSPAQGADRCLTCHYFHPEKERRSELLLYFE